MPCGHSVCPPGPSPTAAAWAPAFHGEPGAAQGPRKAGPGETEAHRQVLTPERRTRQNREEGASFTETSPYVRPPLRLCHDALTPHPPISHPFLRRGNRGSRAKTGTHICSGIGTSFERTGVRESRCFLLANVLGKWRTVPPPPSSATDRGGKGGPAPCPDSWLLPLSTKRGQLLFLQPQSNRPMAGPSFPTALGPGGAAAEAWTARSSRSLAQTASDSGKEAPEGETGRERLGTSQPQAERRQVREGPDSGQCQAGSCPSLS